MLLKINFLLIVIYALTIFVGQQTFLSLNYYDSWRIFQFLIFTFISLQVVSVQNIIKIPKIHSLLLGIFFLSLTTALNALYPVLAGLDLCFYFLFFTSLYILTLQIHALPHVANQATKLIGLTPLMTIGFLPLALILKAQGLNANWYHNFPNYRMLDDIVLPCLFFLFHWQSNSKNKYVKILLCVPIILYLLSFLLNGARANLLAISIALIVSLFLYKNKIKEFIFPITSILVSISIYLLLRSMQIENVGSSLNRATTSGRVDLWEKSITLWLEHPLGVGGANFIFHPPKLFSAHPHNLPLQWLVEWGVVGIVLIVALSFIGYKIICMYKSIPIFIFGFFIAFLVNILFSGTMVYPLSQMINLWGIALIMSFLIKDCSFIFFEKKSFYILLSLIIVVVTWSLIFIILNNNPYLDMDKLYAPRLWLDGYYF